MLAYERTGSGEPLLLIHGISHRRQAWAPVVDRLSTDFEVITVDLPGHGESPALELRGRSVRDAVAETLYSTLDGLGVEQPHIVGNSLGGLIALEAADVGIARSVTALSPAGFWLNELDFAYVRGLFAGVQAAARPLQCVSGPVLGHPVGRSLALGWAAAHPTRIDPEVAREDAANMVASRDAIRTMFTGAYTYRGDLRGEHVDVPLTIAWASRDLTLLPYHALVARRRLPFARHLWLKGCGHVPMSDDPDLVARVIREGTGRLFRADEAA